MRDLLTFITIFALHFSSFAGTKELKTTLSRYQKSSVLANIEKSVKMVVLEKTEKSEGELFFSKGKFRLEMKDPVSTLIVQDGTTLWIASKLVDFGGNWQVSKTKSRSLKKSQALMGLLFDEKGVWKDFDVAEEKTDGDDKIWVLKPKKKASTDIMKLQVRANPKDKTIIEISYWDNLENETNYKFKSQKFDAKISSSKFTYKPPKGAEVTEF